MERRSFLKTGLAALAVLTVIPAELLKAAAKKIALPLSKLPDLKKVGGYMTLKIKGKNILFVRRKAEQVDGFCARCSHADAMLEYKKDKDQLYCPEHGSEFDMDGNPLKGPATKPICKYETAVKDEKILLTMDDGK
mgnify:FL=1